MKTTKLINNYAEQLGDPHDSISDPHSLNNLDFTLRTFMGKTEKKKNKMGYASHSEILKRQNGVEDDDLVCRRCLKDLSIVGEGRYNDFLIIRASDCTQPICSSCAENNPDSYHLKFKEAINMRKTVLNVMKEQKNDM